MQIATMNKIVAGLTLVGLLSIPLGMAATPTAYGKMECLQGGSKVVCNAPTPADRGGVNDMLNSLQRLIAKINHMQGKK